MERHDMLLKLKALKLHGMAAAFDEVIDEGIKRSRTPFEVLGRLLAAEDSERHARSLRYQMTVAKFPEYRELATFEFAESPVNEQQIRMLHEGGFIEEKDRGIGSQSPCHSDSLALAPGELLRIAVEQIGCEANHRQQFSQLVEHGVNSQPILGPGHQQNSGCSTPPNWRGN